MSDGTHYTAPEMIAALAIACPYCNAPGGHHCRATGDLMMVIPHRGRMKAARNAQQARDAAQKEVTA